MYRSKYLILKDRIFNKLSLLNLFIKISFLFNQMILKLDTHTKFIKQNKRERENIMQDYTILS